MPPSSRHLLCPSRSCLGTFQQAWGEGDLGLQASSDNPGPRAGPRGGGCLPGAPHGGARSPSAAWESGRRAPRERLTAAARGSQAMPLLVLKGTFRGPCAPSPASTAPQFLPPQLLLPPTPPVGEHVLALLHPDTPEKWKTAVTPAALRVRKRPWPALPGSQLLPADGHRQGGAGGPCPC